MFFSSFERVFSFFFICHYMIILGNVKYEAHRDNITFVNVLKFKAQNALKCRFPWKTTSISSWYSNKRTLKNFISIFEKGKGTLCCFIFLNFIISNYTSS